MPGYWAAGHHLHHLFGVGPVAGLLVPLAQLLFPLLFFLLLAGAWRGVRAGARCRVARPSQAPGPLRRISALERPMRASDGERDEAARTISEAVGEGRLGLDEARDRIDATFAARYRHELAKLISDLPPAPALPRAATGPSTGRPGLLALAGAVVIGAILLQVLAGLWLLWPLGIVALAAFALSRR